LNSVSTVSLRATLNPAASRAFFSAWVLAFGRPSWISNTSVGPVPEVAVDVRPSGAVTVRPTT
jgi:hypothetical protein